MVHFQKLFASFKKLLESIFEEELKKIVIKKTKNYVRVEKKTNNNHRLHTCLNKFPTCSGSYGKETEREKRVVYRGYKYGGKKRYIPTWWRKGEIVVYLGVARWLIYCRCFV